MPTWRHSWPSSMPSGTASGDDSPCVNGDLGGRLLQSWAHIGFQTGQGSVLTVVVDGLLAFFSFLLALGQQGIPQPAPRLPLLRQQPVLAFGGVQAVCEGLEHASERSPLINSYQSALFCWEQV